MLAVLFAIFLSPTFALSSFEIFGGAITFHFVDEGSSDQFVQKISKNGRLIFNPLFGIRYVGEDQKRFLTLSGFSGNNSVGLPMSGGLFSLGQKFLNQKLYLGLAAGGYIQDDEAFRQKAARPFRLFEFDHGKGFVPIAGLESALRLNFSQKTYTKFYLLVTPIITTSLLMLGLQF